MSFFKKKGWIIFIIILVIALACAYISQMGSNPVSNAVNSVLTPIQTQLARLTNPVKSFFNLFGDIKCIREENERLKSENIELKGSLKTVEECAKAGANVLVAGSAIFGSEDPKETISQLRSLAAKYF